MQAPVVESVWPSPDTRLAAQAGAVLVVTALALAPIAIALARRIFPGRNVYFARWGFSHVVQLALTLVFLFWISGFVAPPPESVPDNFNGPTLDRPLVSELVRVVSVYTLAAALIASFARRLAPEGLRALGWPKGRQLRAILAGLSSYLILLPGILGLGLLWNWFLTTCGIEPTGQEVLRKFLDVRGSQLPLALVLAILVVPFFEELIFRAFLQPLLVQNFSEKGGIAITSFIFAALHGLEAFLPIFGLSLLLGAVMLRTQRLVATWAIHALHNGLMLAFLFAVKELAAPPSVGSAFVP